ncbi:MAG: V-type ATP synthase subunit D [Gammaproteobacteria bacterium]|jgi:V/A-type H+-transporting ATPase subunit D
MREDLTPSQSVLLELREERTVMREGHAFLDEKRALVAAEIIHQLKGFIEVRRRFETAFAAAVQALQMASARHGLDGLQTYPPAGLEGVKLHAAPRELLGVSLVDVETEVADEIPAAGLSPEGDLCRSRFRDLVILCAEMAALEGNLNRLYEDYLKTERRTRALEDVLIPELSDDIRELESMIEMLEQEDALRVRSAG